MVDLALPRRLHAVGQRAIGQARARRSATVEAEHVLLAILAVRSSPATTKLASARLDYDALVAALADERERSLAAAGIAPIAAAALTATPRSTIPGWGASVRDLLRRADTPAAKDGRDGAVEIELSIAILQARIGTVPRALAVAGLDRSALIAALAAGSETRSGRLES